MKGFSIALAVVLALLIICGGVVYFGGALKAEVYAPSVAAAQQQDAFASVKAIIESGGAPYLYSQEALASADHYTLVDISISLKNSGFLPAEWLTVEIVPASSDVAVYSIAYPATDLPARASASINLKILTRDAQASRTVFVNYYVFGMKRTCTISC